MARRETGEWAPEIASCFKTLTLTFLNRVLRMAILVAAGGAALGTALGVGPSAGWLVGAAVGNLLFPASGQDSRVEGPRLGDLTVTSSAYGAPVAIAYGTIRLARQPDLVVRHF
jgi:hypothetical protein